MGWLVTLTGFGGASVLEIVDHYHGDTYRAVWHSDSEAGP